MAKKVLLGPLTMWHRWYLLALQAEVQKTSLFLGKLSGIWTSWLPTAEKAASLSAEVTAERTKRRTLTVGNTKKISLKCNMCFVRYSTVISLAGRQGAVLNLGGQHSSRRGPLLAPNTVPAGPRALGPLRPRRTFDNNISFLHIILWMSVPWRQKNRIIDKVNGMSTFLSFWERFCLHSLNKKVFTWISPS